MCLWVSYMKKIWEKKLFFCILKKGVGSRVGSRSGSISPRCGSGSEPKCHGSPTLIKICTISVSFSLLSLRITIANPIVRCTCTWVFVWIYANSCCTILRYDGCLFFFRYFYVPDLPRSMIIVNISIKNKTVLRIRNVYHGSRIPYPGSKKIPDPVSASKNLSIFNLKKCF